MRGDGHPAAPDDAACPPRWLKASRLALATLLLVAAVALGACAPVVMSAGLSTMETALAADALVMADGAKLPLRAWLPEGEPRAVVLGLHGYGDHSGNAFEAPAPLLTASGIALYAYDQRGFGAAPHRGYWAGAPTLVSDAVAAARLVRARHPGVPFYMMGESMGVAVLLVAATSPQPPPADGYVLLAPAVRGRASMGAFAGRFLTVMSWVMPAVAFYGSSPGFAPTDNEEAMERWSRDPLTLKQFRVDMLRGLVDLMDAAVAAAPRFRAPALILYGAKDRLVAGRRCGAWSGRCPKTRRMSSPSIRTATTCCSAIATGRWWRRTSPPGWLGRTCPCRRAPTARGSAGSRPDRAWSGAVPSALALAPCGPRHLSGFWCGRWRRPRAPCRLRQAASRGGARCAGRSSTP